MHPMLCAIYEKRPQICVEWPKKPEHLKGFDKCGFYFDEEGNRKGECNCCGEVCCKKMCFPEGTKTAAEINADSSIEQVESSTGLTGQEMLAQRHEVCPFLIKG